jgi:hypothetical protein
MVAGEEDMDGIKTGLLLRVSMDAGAWLFIFIPTGEG